MKENDNKLNKKSPLVQPHSTNTNPFKSKDVLFDKEKEIAETLAKPNNINLWPN